MTAPSMYGPMNFAFTNAYLWSREATQGVLWEVENERRLQEEVWGQQNLPHGTGSRRHKTKANVAKSTCEMHRANKSLTNLHVLDEEVQEAFAESDPKRLREELIQVAAVAVKMIEQIDRETKVEG